MTLREAPGATAECSPCEVEIKDSANSVTWDGIGLNATGYPLDVIALHIYGDDALVENSEIQNRQDICVIVGSHTYGVAHRPRLIHNRIHNCGANHVWNEQTIYLEATRGARVEDNTLYKAWDFGISMYDDAQDSVISHNVIDGAMLQAGVVFGSTDAGKGYCSVNNNNIVRDNIITTTDPMQQWTTRQVAATGQGTSSAQLHLGQPLRRLPSASRRLHSDRQHRRRSALCQPGVRRLQSAAGQSVRGLRTAILGASDAGDSQGLAECGHKPLKCGLSIGLRLDECPSLPPHLVHARLVAKQLAYRLRDRSAPLGRDAHTAPDSPDGLGREASPA